MKTSLRVLEAVVILAAAVLFGAGRLAAQDSQMSHGNMGQDTMAHPKMAHDSMMSMMPHGTFSGASGHKVSGTYQVQVVDGKQILQLGSDFSLDNAPDPYVVLSPSGKGTDPGALNLGLLKKLKGEQAYPLPAGADLSKYTEVLIWCKKFNVPLGSASLASQGEMMQ